MKILIVNTSDIRGGAARAAYRLHCSLRKNNIDSTMLVLSRDSDCSHVITPTDGVSKVTNKFRNVLEQASLRKYDNSALFSPAVIPSSQLIKQINALNPDIVHLHWINSGMIRIEDLKKIKAPIVWSLHDMWAFTGGCHYNEGCGLYKQSCGTCKVLRSGKVRDLSRRVYLRKAHIYPQIENFTIVGLSRWMATSARDSSLLSKRNIVNLPNPIDTDIYKKFDSHHARNLWNLPKNRKLVLFGAMSATSDPRKGFRQLVDALKHLESNEVECVVFGANEPDTPLDIGLKVHFVGKLHDDASLVSLYSAVDVMVVTSLQENLSNAIMESLTCETPVVAFDIGGNRDLVDHDKSGYLATPFDAKDIALGIKRCLEKNLDGSMSRYARQCSLERWSYSIVSEKYTSLYKSLIS